jgi:hypothetical protein
LRIESGWLVVAISAALAVVDDNHYRLENHIGWCFIAAGRVDIVYSCGVVRARCVRGECVDVGVEL